LKGFQEDLEEKTSVLDEVKRVASKASKALDKALKDIAARVCMVTQVEVILWNAHPFSE
jgi:hypothetical protein